MVEIQCRNKRKQRHSGKDVEFEVYQAFLACLDIAVQFKLHGPVL